MLGFEACVGLLLALAFLLLRSLSSSKRRVWWAWFLWLVVVLAWLMMTFTTEVAVASMLF